MKQTIATVSLLLYCASTLAQTANLPDFGTPADSVLNKSQEAQIGRGVLAQLRNAGAVLEDPQVTEYIQTLGAKLAGNANDGDQSFHFFVVDDGAINAFAVPGGYIGMNTGLILASESESEVAGVFAHEVAHVTQRHIARSIYDNQRNSVLSMAAMIAAVLLGAASGAGGDAMTGIITASQSAMIQSQINFTRANEHEADRIGMGTLAAAGFNPTGMASFFEKLSRRYGLSSQYVPAILQTHPVTSERIAEARERARQLPAVDVENSLSYEVMRARLEVIQAPTGDAAFEIFQARIERGSEAIGDRYGIALSLSRMGLDDDAQRLFSELIREHPGVIAFRIGEAEALTQDGLVTEALSRYSGAIELFPRNVPLTISYAEALIAGGKPDVAHKILLDLLNNTSPTPKQFRLITRAANAEGDIGNAHHYMSHYHISVGNLSLAASQLRMALEAPGVDTVDRARFRSEYTELEEYMEPEQKRRRRDEDDEGQTQIASR